MTTLCAKYNDIESVKQIFADNKGEIAGVILEPVVGNSGFIAPTQEFLEVNIVRQASLALLDRAFNLAPMPVSHERCTSRVSCLIRCCRACGVLHIRRPIDDRCLLWWIDSHNQSTQCSLRLVACDTGPAGRNKGGGCPAVL